MRGAPPVRRSLPWATEADDNGHWAGEPVFTVALRSPRQLTGALLDRCPAVVYLPLEAARQVQGHFDEMRALGIEPCVILPRVLWDRETAEVERALARLRDAGLESALAGNLGSISLARRAGLRVRGDFGLEVYNSECAAMYRALGLESATLSFEQRLSRVREQPKPLKSELLVYGRLPLMITQNCIYKARDGKCKHGCEAKESILDRRRARFPVLQAYGCRNEIFNSLPLWLADKGGELNRAGLWALRLNFTLEEPQECVDILDAYLGRSDYRPEQYTRGLYFRDVE